MQDDIPLARPHGPSDADLDPAFIHDEDHDGKNADGPDEKGNRGGNPPQDGNQGRRLALQSQHVFGVDNGEIVFLARLEVVPQAQDLLALRLCRNQRAAVGGLHEDVIHIVFVDEPTEEGIEGHEDLVVLIDIRRIDALLLHHPDDPAGNAPDEDGLPEGAVAAKELFRDLPADDGDPLQSLILLIGDEAAFLRVKIPHLRIVGGGTGNQDRRQRDTAIANRKVLGGGR